METNFSPPFQFTAFSFACLHKCLSAPICAEERFSPAESSQCCVFMKCVSGFHHAEWISFQFRARKSEQKQFVSWIERMNKGNWILKIYFRLIPARQQQGARERQDCGRWQVGFGSEKKFAAGNLWHGTRKTVLKANWARRVWATLVKKHNKLNLHHKLVTLDSRSYPPRSLSPL